MTIRLGRHSLVVKPGKIGFLRISSSHIYVFIFSTALGVGSAVILFTTCVSPLPRYDLPSRGLR